MIYDELTFKHENGYIVTKFSTNIQASNKGKKNYCHTARKKKDLIHVIYIYIYTKTLDCRGLVRPNPPTTHSQTTSVSVP